MLIMGKLWETRSWGCGIIFTKTYRPLIKEGLKADKPECFRCPYGKNFYNCEAECFEKMEKLIEENKDEIAAVIIEPVVQGAAGMKIYSPKYIQKLREITKKNMESI